MKKETNKKSKLWLWILLALLALAIIGGVVAAFVLPGLMQPQGPTGPVAEAELYWNLDRTLWIEEETNMSAREKGEDGYYHIRYAFDGKVEELKVTDDKRLVNYLDSQDVICLAFDENGIVVDCAPASTYFTPAAKELYTKRVQNNILQLNSSMAMNGMDMEFDISGIPVYEVSEGSEEKGSLITPQWLDVVTVYNDLEGNPYAAYVTGHLAINAEVGWRVEHSMYAASTGYKRVPDKDGVYTIPFAINGEIVNRYIKDYDMAINIESQSMYSAYFALEFDEDGYIIDWENPAMALQGTQLCQAFNVDSVTEDGLVTATRYLSGNNQGESVTFTYDDTCEIYQCCIGECYEKHCGERIDSLRVGDMINVFTDLDGKPILIYVSVRTVDGPAYYNLVQKYSSALKETTRVPDEDGYYVFDMAVNGGVKTVRTKSKEIATKIDSSYNYVFGLELNGSVIKKVNGIQCVSGRGIAFGGRFVTSYNKPIVSIASSSDITNVANWIIADGCKIYTVDDNFGVKLGSKTDITVGNKVLGLMDARGELCYIYVQQSYNAGFKMGYNMARKYSTATNSTTRIPDAEGYYVYDVAYNGEIIQLKTKNKAMADFIDLQNAPVFGFKEKDGIITNVCTAASAVPFGVKANNYNNVESLDGGIMTTWYMNSGVKTLSTAKWKLTSKTKVYNVSKGYDDHRGEKSKVKIGDKVQNIVNISTGEIVYTYIMNRPIDSPIYWMVSRVAPRYVNGDLAGSNRKPDAEGYYVFDLLCDGEIKQYKTKDEMIAAEVDTYTQGLGLKLKEGTNIIERVVAVADTKYPTTAIGNADVKSVKGNTITTERCRLTSSNYGEELTVTLGKNVKIYNVSSYAEKFGAPDKLEKGDRIVAYSDLENNIAYIFITKAAARDKGVWGHCDHCGKTVFWDSYSENFAADGHYYLPADTERGTITFGSTTDDAVYDQVFDLNGHSLKSTASAFTVYDKLTIIDSVGGGKVINGKGVSVGGTKQGGNIYVGEGGTFTLLSGTIADGAVGLSGVGSNISAFNGTVNIKGGTISGGIGYLGTAVYHGGTKGGINISGGTLSGSVFAEESNMITLSGAPVIEKLIVAPGTTVKVGALKAGAKITVKGDGIFATDVANIETVKNYFVPANSADTITVSGNSLKYNNLSGEQVVPEPESPNKPLVLDANGVGLCVLCGENVQWIALRNGDVIGDMNPAHDNYNAELFGGDQKHFHYYVAEDMTAGDGDFLYTWQGKGVCLHLNGKTLNVRGGFYGGNGGTINIYGEGKVHFKADATESLTAGNMFEVYTSNVSIYGGEFTTATNMIHGAGSAANISISDEAIINGNVKMDYGNVTISGGVNIKRIALGETAKLTIGRLFKGTTSLSVAAGLEEGNLIPEANVAVLGKYSGKLTYSDFRDIVYVDGRLQVQGEAPSPNDALVLDENGMGICYVCGENVQWIALRGGERIGDVHSDGQSVHYYVAEDMTAADGNFQYLQDKSANVSAKATATICLHLNGHILNVKGIIENGHGSINNIMGNGVVLNGGSMELFQNYSATLNLYGGQYYGGDYPVFKALTEASKLNVMGNAKLYGNVELPFSGLTLKESAHVDNVVLGNTVSQKDTDGDGVKDTDVITYGKVTVAANFAGNAKLTVDAANMDGEQINAKSGVAQGDFTGTLINQDGLKFVNSEGLLKLTAQTGTIPAAPAAPAAPAVATPPVPAGINDPLVLDSENKAKCVHCGEEVVWTPIANGEKIGKPAAAGGSEHYYLTEDNTSNGLFFTSDGNTGNNTICLHLNGHNLTSQNGFTLQNGNKFNLMGNGTVTANDGMMFEIWTCTANIYGGTYNADIVMNTASANSIVSVLGDVQFNGLAQVAAGRTYFAHNVSAEKVEVSGTGKLQLASGWNGTMEISVADSLMEGNLVKKSAVELIGAVNGTITHTDGVVTVVNGQLSIALPEPETPVWGVFNPEECNGFAFCEHCGEAAGPVKWTALTGSNRIGAVGSGLTAGEKHHIYLSGDVDVNKTLTQTLSMSSGASVCLHLNGNDLANHGRMFAGGVGSLAIMGDGNVLFAADTTFTGADANAYKQALVAQCSGGLYLYGGTYYVVGAALEADLPTIKATCPVFIKDATINGYILADANSTITLEKGAVVNEIRVAGSGKVVIADGWSGTAVLNIPVADIVNNLIATSRVAVNGDFTGTITLTDGRTAVKEGNQLKVIGEAADINADLVLDNDNKAECLHCGEVVTWTPIANGEKIGKPAAAGGSEHYYLAEDNTSSGTFFTSDGNTGSNTICLHLNGHNLTTAGGFIFQNANTINLMGKGTVTHSGTNGWMFEIWTATVNIYGGTYNSTAGTFAIKSAASNVTISGNATLNCAVAMEKGNLKVSENTTFAAMNITGGKLTIAEGWARTMVLTVPEADIVNDVISASRVAVSGNFTGTITLADGRTAVKEGNQLKITAAASQDELVLDPDGKAICPACGEAAGKVQWTAVEGTGRIGFFDDGTHRHYYLSNDLNVANTWSQVLGVNNTNFCLHLNGKNLTSGGRIFAGGTSVLSIMGSGNVTFTAETTTPGASNEYISATIQAPTSGGVYLYGGTYNVSGAAATAGKPTILATGKVFIKNATVNGDIVANNTANIQLEEGAVAEEIQITANAKLIVAENWTGTANASFASALEDDKVPAKNGVAEGDFTGTLKLTTGEKLVNDNTSLKVERTDPVWGVFEPWNYGGRAYCEACGQDAGIKTWTVYDGSNYDEAHVLSDAGVTHYHFYLDGNVEYDTANYLNTYEKICFHLNGHSITATGAASGAPISCTQVLSVMGEGIVTGGTPAGADIGSVFNVNGGNASATLKIYGGTYKKPANSTNPLLSVGTNGGKVYIYGGTFDVNGSSVAGERGNLLYVQGRTTNGTKPCLAAVEISGGTFIGDSRIGSKDTNDNKPGAASLKVLGGTFNGKVALTNACQATLGGAAVVNEISVTTDSKLTVKANFTGKAALNLASALEDNKVPAANAVAEGAFSGILSLTNGDALIADGTTLKVPANNALLKDLQFTSGTTAHCAICNADVVWTDVATKSDKRIGYQSNKGHLHLYLSEDMIGSDTLQFAEFESGTIACFHLNGHNLTLSSRFIVSTGTVNILGRGNVVFEGDCVNTSATNQERYNSVGFEVSTGATLNVYGGSYATAGAALEGGKPMMKASTATSAINLFDVSVTGTVQAVNGNVTVDASACVDKLTVSTYAKLNVAGTFTGSVVADFASGLVGDAVPEKNGASTGAFTGSVTLLDGTTVLIGDSGKLIKNTATT